MSPEQDLETIRALVRRVAGASSEAIIAAAAADWPDDPQEQCEALWDDLYRTHPEEFGSPGISPDESTALGFAFRYAQHHRLPGVGRLELDEEQQEAVDYARTPLREWSGLDTWHGFEHYVFDEECVELAATWRLRNSGTGVSFTFHPCLERTALYYLPRLEPLLADDADPCSIAGVLLHEEAHLASGSGAGTFGPDDGGPALVFELFGRLAFEFAWVALIEEPVDRAHVTAAAAEHDEAELVDYLARFPVGVELDEIVQATAELAVVAARSTDEFEQAERRIFG